MIDNDSRSDDDTNYKNGGSGGYKYKCNDER